jgi:hypothetical protein
MTPPSQAPPVLTPPPAPVPPAPVLLDVPVLVVPTAPPLHAVAPIPTEAPSSPKASSARTTILEADRELARELSTT